MSRWYSELESVEKESEREETVMRAASQYAQIKGLERRTMQEFRNNVNSTDESAGLDLAGLQRMLELQEALDRPDQKAALEREGLSLIRESTERLDAFRRFVYDCAMSHHANYILGECTCFRICPFGECRREHVNRWIERELFSCL